MAGGRQEQAKKESQPQSGKEISESVNGDGKESYKPRRAPRTRRNTEKINGQELRFWFGRLGKEDFVQYRLEYKRIHICCCVIGVYGGLKGKACQ